MSIFYIFVRNNFIRFLWDDYIENENILNNGENNDNDDEEESTNKKSKSKKEDKKGIFLANYNLRIFILKILAEKFSPSIIS